MFSVCLCHTKPCKNSQLHIHTLASHLHKNYPKMSLCGGGTAKTHSSEWTNSATLGWEPWSSALGRDSRSKGRGFESRHRILDGIFSQIFVVKIVLFV